MEEIMIDLKLKSPAGKIDDAMGQLGFHRKGNLKYDYPELGHKWYERIKTELYEKDEQLFYFANVSEWDGDKISQIRIGKVENKRDKNPECVFF